MTTNTITAPTNKDPAQLLELKQLFKRHPELLQRALRPHLEELADTLATLDNRLDDLDSTIEDLDSRLDDAESSAQLVEDLQAGLQDLRDKVDEPHNRAKDLEKSVERLSLALHRLAREVPTPRSPRQSHANATLRAWMTRLRSSSRRVLRSPWLYTALVAASATVVNRQPAFVVIAVIALALAVRQEGTA